MVHKFSKNIFATLLLLSMPALLFAPGDRCIGYGSQCDRASVSACLSSVHDCSVRDNWFCGVPCGDSGNGARGGHGFGGFAQSASGSSSQGSSGPTLKDQVSAVTQQTLCEYYRTEDGRLCTNAERLEAARAVIGVINAVRAGEMTEVRATQISDLLGRLGIDFGCFMSDEEVIAECNQTAKDIKKEVTAKLLTSLSRLSSIKNGIYKVSAAQSYTALNGRVCTEEEARTTAQTLQQLAEDVASKRITPAQQARIILSMSAAGIPLICATATLEASQKKAQEAAEKIKKEITGKALALPGIDDLIMHSVSGLTVSNNIGPIAKDISETVFMGDTKAFFDRAEHFTKRCLRQNEMHICYSLNQANGMASLHDATPETRAAFFAQVQRDIEANIRSGAI